LLLASVDGGVIGPFGSVCITGIISTAASIQMHTNAYTCIHNTHAYPISVIACLLPFEDALRSWVGGAWRLVRILQVRHCNQHQHCCKHKHRRSEHRNSHNNKHRTSTAGSTRQTDDSLYSLFCVRLPNNAHTSARTARAMR
jgi:hypothetical protein